MVNYYWLDVDLQFIIDSSSRHGMLRDSKHLAVQVAIDVQDDIMVISFETLCSDSCALLHSDLVRDYHETRTNN